jgi:hypothetical protein
VTKTRDVLTVLGFREINAPLSERQLGYALDLGNIQFEVIECVNQYFLTVLLMTGFRRSEDSRSTADIEFSLPLEVDSFEQGVALVVYAISTSMGPTVPPPWFALGKEWKDRLPWLSDRTSSVGPQP